MKISFPYKSEPSHIFGSVKRPVAEVAFWSERRKRWLNYNMIIDTGADYALLPYSASNDLAINLEEEAKEFSTFGIGGSEKVFLVREYKIRIEDINLVVPVGFLRRDDIPPLLGRQECLNNLDLRFFQFQTFFSSPV